MSSPEIFVRYRPEKQCIDLIMREEENDGTFAYAYGMTFARPSINEKAPVAVSLSEIGLKHLWIAYGLVVFVLVQSSAIH